ncbi:major tail protein [Paenibacillus brevis]|uniref:Ig-like domain-containing protein n=1 Tax=Paenibacillus brevis TaxID=2841508 RepID=A0ABS6FJ99_9BACL|nr:major tail protein [Paenibacillus brevis]MBU5670250.1 Ig-like domain-containing protein [Paenibacillus brevis]
MDKQYGEFVGVDSLNFALVTDTESSYSATTPDYLAPVGEIAAEAETNNTPTYYDNVPGNNYVSEGVTTVTITVSNVPVKKAALLLGKDFDEATGRLLDSGMPNPPDVALGYRANIGRSDHRYTWYAKGTFSGGAEEAATKNSDVDIRTYQLTYTAVATTHQFLINGERKPIKKISGDTTNPAFNPAGWFAQVQTPDTATPPDTLAVTSVPAANATGVEVDSDIVFTFNNKIKSYSVTLIDELLQPVGASPSLSPDGKVLTISPAADLSASTSYVAILTDVQDVYGQHLPNTIVNFETA